MPPAAGPALDFERDLNPQQLAAVTHGDGPQLVLAGAGSGKTRVITYRVAYLVQRLGVDPAAIVAVTFTNKAAAEMHERVERLLGMEALATFVGTFHRFALRLLRRWGDRVGLEPGFIICDDADQLALVKRALAAEHLSESAFTPRAVLAAIGSAKNRLLDPASYESAARGFFEQRVAAVYRRYQGLLRQASGVDFDDMLRLAVRLLAREEDVRARLRERLRYLLVDEFQDTNLAQMRLVQELVGREGNLTAVGDEDQGIYRWRGADLDNVLNFEESFPGAVVRKLERNYRSTQRILDVAGQLVAYNRNRRGKKLWTDAGAGEPLELYRARDEQDEAHWLVSALLERREQCPLREMAVLVRTNAQTRAFEEELLERQVPYTLVGGVRFYDRAEIRDLVAYLRAIHNPRDNLSLLRILNRPPRGIGKATRELLTERAAEFGGVYWDALRNIEPGSLPQRSGRALARFRELIAGLRATASGLSLAALLGELIERTGYAAMYDAGDPEGQAKLENVAEFVSAAEEFGERAGESRGEDQLTAFLDHVALVSDLDGWQREQGVSLMTLHSAKGLEFRAAAVAGLEEGLLPHFNAGGAPEDIEEERRLLYVGMTRARERLLLSCARRRRIAGRYQEREPSRFLAELPAGEIEVSESPDLFVDSRTRGAYAFFGHGDRRDRVEEPAAGGKLARGRRVLHPTLGEGVLLDSEGEGDQRKLTVVFQRAGKRKLLAKYAHLELL